MKLKIAGLGAAVVALVVALIAVVAMAMVSAVMMAANQNKGGGGAAGGLSSKVPAEMVAWIQRSAAQCQPPLTPALLAAQLSAESNFNAQARSAVGAQGVAQIMPANQSLVHDDDGNGTASALDVGDAIMAQGRLMCSYVDRLKVYQGDELLRYMLASYNAGPYAVLPSPCAKATVGGGCQAKIPPYPETQNYVAKIMASMASFAAPGGLAGGAATGGAWTMPVAGQYSVGAVFRQYGGHWTMCGWHTGYDFSVPIGTNIQAAHSGTVIHASWGGEPGGTGGAYGNQVIIDHGNGLRSYYDHLSSFGVSNGQQVQTGQVIGLSGATGNVTGPHLHFEITTGATGAPACGTFVDPHAYIQQHANDQPAGAAGDEAGTGTGAAAVDAAKAQLGVPYVYGGGSLTGPSQGGFDCSSLVRYAWYKASGGQIELPRVTTDQINATQTIDESELRPGDLVFFKTDSTGTWSHVGLYIGGGQMVHAPNPSTVVKIAPINSGYYKSIPTTYRRVTA